MNLQRTRIHILDKPKSLNNNAKTGVSLHCHTQHSKEMLDFIPHYAEKLPIIATYWRHESKNYQKREGKGIDFSTAYWSPPLSGQAVYDIEKTQIEEADLTPIVSLTDHDNIEANLQVNSKLKSDKAPISLEWTVPFEFGFFHVGVHNLPESRAKEISDTLLAFTFEETDEPDKEKLHELFAMLEEIPEVLVVLNHPLWDIEIVGQERHEILLDNFVKEFGKWIHAFEINGFRAWSENKAVLELAESLGFPTVTGGDRHGCKPNTVINLTNSKTFSEFVDEVRVDKRSEVVLMPEYKYPLHSRQLQSFSEILSHYPEFAEGRRRWFDRVFFDIGDEKGLAPLSDHGWRLGGPFWLRVVIKSLGLLGSPKLRFMFSIARNKKDRVPRRLDSDLIIPPISENKSPRILEAETSSAD